MIVKPTYTKRRFGIGMSSGQFSFHAPSAREQFPDWYTKGYPYWSFLSLMVDVGEIRYNTLSIWNYIKNTIVPAFNNADVALILRISLPVYDDEVERQATLNELAALAGASCLQKGYIYHDFEFGKWKDGRSWTANKPPLSEYKAYWYDWWWNELKNIDPNFTYVIDKYYTPEALSELEPDGSPKFLWKSGNISPSRHEGVTAVVGPTKSFMGIGHSAWQFEAKEDWADPNYPSVQGFPGLGDYFINLNFQGYDSLGVGQSAAQRMPFLSYGIEMNMYPWNPVGREPYIYDPNFEALIKDLVYQNVLARPETYMMNLNSTPHATLSGIVKDASTGLPISGALVRLERI